MAWKGWHSLLLLGFVLAIGALVVWTATDGFNPASGNEPALWIWLLVLGLLAGLMLLLGHGIKGDLGGLLIDERNRMSLARLQTSLWTVLILGSYFVAYLANLADDRPNPLEVSIPTELWLAMGISVTSLLGSRLILGSQETRALRGGGGNLVHARENVADASWGDLFRGDYEAGHTYVALTKVQMFFFTLILVLGYAAAVGDVFVDIGTPKDGMSARGVGALPELDRAFVILLGLSHGGYLTRKVLPETPPGSPDERRRRHGL